MEKGETEHTENLGRETAAERGAETFCFRFQVFGPLPRFARDAAYPAGARSAPLRGLPPPAPLIGVIS